MKKLKFIEQIEHLLFKAEMKQVAINISGESKYAFEDKLYEEIKHIILMYEISVNEVKFYKHYFK